MSKIGTEYLESRTKSRFERAVSIAAALGTLPLALAAGTAAAIDNKGDLFFRQKRGGQDIIKFRTIPKELSEGPMQLFHTDDPRSTAVGLFLRRTRLDEIPQLWLPALGKGKLIGMERMLVDEELEKRDAADPILFADWYPHYTQFMAPLSEAAISRSAEPEITKAVRIASMQKGMAYREKASLATDIDILMRTPPQMARNVLARHAVKNVVELPQTKSAV